MRLLIRVAKVTYQFLKLFFVIQLLVRLIRRYYKFPAPAFIGTFLDSDLRRRLQPPESIITRSGVETGMRVLEVGCGSGVFTTAVARTVGEYGTVFALDIQAEMLEKLQEKLNRPENQDIKNVTLLHESAYGLPFVNGSLDLVYMVAAFQEIPDKPKALAEIKRVLKPGGCLAISEFLPDPDYPWMSTTSQMGLRAGFIIDRIEGNLWNYTVRFKKVSS
jgi:ubiquinone/menaquinone biosynthesis C-methylase UbiE